MTAEEFTEWKLVFAHEGMAPVADARRHAEMLAATYQGASIRKDKGPWLPTQFFAEPWSRALHAPPRANGVPPVQKQRPPVDRAQMLAHVAAMNARIRR